jgi:hypothetical protein
MKADDPLGQNNSANPYPPRPQQRPMNDFGPASPRQMQRPMNDFAPRPASSERPMQSFRPQQPSAQRPASMPDPYRQMQPQMAPAASRPSYMPAKPAQPMSFEPPKTKRKLGFKKILSVSSVALLLIACSYVFIATGNDGSKKSTAKAQNSQPAIKPLESAGFTTYYPSPLPTGLTPTKGSITYYKDSFTFILQQNGQKSFFVYEQPASTDPGFNSLKGKLAAPKSIALTIGQGIEGGLDNGIITAVKTDKNTIIMVDCVKAVCSTTAHDILSNMQVNDKLEELRKSNS